MNRSVVVLACIAVLAACGPESSNSSGDAAISTSVASQAATPASCPSGTLESALALRSNGGGCTPFGIAAALADPTNPANLDLLLQQLVAVNPEWAPVVNGGASPVSTPVLIHGKVIDSHLSTTDFPSTHVSIDQNTDILLDDEDKGCAATGNATAELDDLGRIKEPHIELEWEADRYPAWAWAGTGDRIVALGRWIFDCGHEDPIPGVCRGSTDLCILDGDCGAGGGTCDGIVFNYHSELHPPQAVAVIRTGRGAPVPTPGDHGAATPTSVTRADVFVSGDGGGAGDACVLTPVSSLDALLFAQNCFPFHEPLAPINGFDFTFDVPLPDVPHHGAPFWRIVEQSDGAPAVPAKIVVEPSLTGPGSPGLHVRVLMTKPVGGTLPTGFAGTLFAGWLKPDAPPLQHVRVTIDGIEVRNALAHDLPVPNPHAWRVEAAVNGEWQRFADVPADVGFFAANLVYDQWLLPDGKLTVHAQAESEGCEDSVRGNALSTILGTFAQIDPQNALLLAAACITDLETDDGEIDTTFAGPLFGAQAAPYVVESAKGAWALKFHVERVDAQ